MQQCGARGQIHGAVLLTHVPQQHVFGRPVTKACYAASVAPHRYIWTGVGRSAARQTTRTACGLRVASLCIVAVDSMAGSRA
jgi:hypothetical protein